MPVSLMRVALLAITAASVLGCTANPGSPSQTASETAADSSQAPAAVSPAIIREPWLEDQLVAELRHGLEPLLPDLGLDNPEGRRTLDRVLPAAFSTSYRVHRDPEEVRALMWRKDSTQQVKVVKQWLGFCESLATSRKASQFGGLRPTTAFVVEPLPEDPALGVVFALQTEWMGARANSTSEQLAKAAAEAKRQNEAPEVTKARAQTMMSSRDEAPPLISDALAKAVASERFAGERIQMIGLLIVRLDKRSFDNPTHLRAAQLYAARPDADPWLASLYLGTVLQAKAWLARGDRYVSETSPEQFRALHQELDLAYEQLAKAHAIAPHRPHAAGLLVTQAMGTTNPAHEAPGFWFDQALKADPTWTDAFTRMGTAVLQRWGGSSDDRLAIARLIQQAARQPGSGSIAISARRLMALALEEGGISANERLAEEVLAALRPLWKDADESTAKRTRVDPDDAWSLALVIACQSRNVAAACDLLEEKGRLYARRDDFDLNLDVDWDQLLTWTLERHPSDGALFRQMNAAFGAGDWDTTVKHATTLAATAKNWRAAEAANAMLVTAEAARRFAAGETIDLIAPEFRDAWRVSEASREQVLGGASIAFTRPTERKGFRDDASFPMRLAGRFRMEIDLSYDLPAVDIPALDNLVVLSLRLVDIDHSSGIGRESTMSGKESAEIQRRYSSAVRDAFALSVGRRGIFSRNTKSSLAERKTEVALTDLPRSVVIDVEGSGAHILIDGQLFDIVEWVPPSKSSRSSRRNSNTAQYGGGIEGDLTLGAANFWRNQFVFIDSIRVTRVSEPLPRRTLDGPK
jgi:hypothetical protein